MITLLFLLACGPSAEVPHAHAAEPEHRHEHHGHDDATVHHRFDDAEKWAKVFDDPERDAWQKPQDVVAAMRIESGMAVSDIGAGTGYFNPHLSRAVGPDGQVIAIDIEQSLVDHMAERAKTEGTSNVVPRLGQPDDPGLKPAEVDRVLLVDTYHHISDRLAYFGALRQTLRPDGQLIVVDFKPGELPVGPGPDHKIAPDQVEDELKRCGWTTSRDDETLPYQWIVVAEPVTGSR